MQGLTLRHDQESLARIVCFAGQGKVEQDILRVTVSDVYGSHMQRVMNLRISFVRPA